MDLASELPPPRLGDRSLFPDLEAPIYLNHAAISPPSLRVRAAIRACADAYGRSGVGAFFTWMEQRQGLVAGLAGLIGADADEIGLTSGTSAGLTAIALSLPWRAGDQLVLFEGEFPANVTPWQRAAALFDLEIVWARVADFAVSHAAGIERLEARLRGGRVRLVAVSAVQFQSGLRMPLAAIAALGRAHGAELCVDAVQACGAAPIDVVADGIDYLAGGGHKWMMGVEGAGFLYVRRALAPALRRPTAGWLSHEEGVRFLLEGPGHLRYDRPLRVGAEATYGGGLNAIGHAALGAALDTLTALGVPAISAHIAGYLDALEPALVARGLRSLRSREPAGRSGILALLPPEGVDVVRLHHALGAQGVAASIPDGVLRFAPHWPNHLAEVPRLLAAVDAALATC